MAIKSAALVFLFALNANAAEVEKKLFDIPVTAPTNLMQESTLKLEAETSVQEIAPRSDLIFGVLAGTTAPHSVNINAGHGRSLDYDFSKTGSMSLISAQMSYFPFAKKWGKLGFSGSVGYSYGEYRQSAVTALHILPLELSAMYRCDLKSTQWAIPFISYGPQVWSIFQRGIDQYNTSENFDAWAGSLGVAFNLNRLKILSSRNDTEIIFQYKRSFATPSARSDMNSQTYQVGGAFSL